MISAIISRVVILLFGTLYPAYASYKAVRTKNVKEYVKWMMYWIVFALFTCAEIFTDLFLSFWFPFYYETKIVLVIWLLSPATKGSSILYRNFVHPALIKREPEIDEYISKAKEQGYHTMLQLGSKGVSYATNVIVQTAMKGGGGIVNHIRRSYSLSDLSNDPDAKSDLNRNTKAHGDTVDSAQVPRDLRLRAQRKQVQVGSHIDLYFPEMDVDFRSHPHELPVSLSQIRSSEDVSCGYSSGDPLYAEGQPPLEGNPLMRTASVGGVRARSTRTARTSTSQPKKPLTAEEEEEDVTDCYEWPQAFPFPITSMYSELLSPLGIPPEALLNPEFLEQLLNNSFYSSQSPVNVFEVREQQEDNVNMDEKTKKDEYFEVFEQPKVLETPTARSVSAPDGTENKKLSEDVVQEKCSENMSEEKSQGPKPLINLSDIPHSENVASGVALGNELHKSSQKSQELSSTDQIINTSTKMDSEENENKRISECFEDATDVEISSSNLLDKQENISSKGNNADKVLLEDTEKAKKRISECFEDATDTEISSSNLLVGHEDFSSKDCIISSTDISGTLVNVGKEKKRNSECFEDATDGEIIFYNILDEESSNGDITNQIQSETSERAASNISLTSSNDQFFEDSLPDATRSGSLSINDRKGKYKKKHAPPPPDVRSSAEPELLPTTFSDNERKDEETEKPDLLIESHSPSTKSIPSDYSSSNKKSNSDYDVVQKSAKMNVTSHQHVEKMNIPPTSNMRETSPSPSQVSKKDQSNFSRFLPRASVSSFFNLWGSKEGSAKSKACSSHSSSGTTYVPIAPSNLETNIQYVPDIGDSSKEVAKLSKSTPKLKIRQMSHSPSRRKRHEYE